MSDNNYVSPWAWHRRLFEGRALLFAVSMTLVVAIGGIVEILPMYSAALGPEPMAGITPYTPLQLAGRDIYVAEGCYNCHSQWIRPFRSETLRYGPWSRAGEYAYDRPFQLGSRRIGPDLMRVGVRLPTAGWHYEHLMDPRELVSNSIMPSYHWLADQKIDPDDIKASVVAMKRLGVPYTDADVGGVAASLAKDGQAIVDELAVGNIKAEPDEKMVALVAYLKSLGVEGTAAIAAEEQK